MALPSLEELEQMSTEDLEALAGQVAQEGMAAGLGGPGALPGQELPEEPPPGPEELPVEEAVEVSEAVEDTGAPLEEAEPILGQILTTTQDPKEILDILRSQGFEIRRLEGAAQAEVAEQEAELEEGPEESTATISEPTNMRDLRKKAAANALKGA